MKYLIVEDFSGQAVPFIFPRRVDHVDMREQLPYGQVLSAGFLELGPQGFICSGGHAELGGRLGAGEPGTNALVGQFLAEWLVGHWCDPFGVSLASTRPEWTRGP